MVYENLWHFVQMLTLVRTTAKDKMQKMWHRILCYTLHFSHFVRLLIHNKCITGFKCSQTAWMMTFGRRTECECPTISLSTMSSISLYSFIMQKINRWLIQSGFSRIMISLRDHLHLCNTIIAMPFSYFPYFIFTCMTNYWAVELETWVEGK